MSFTLCTVKKGQYFPRTRTHNFGFDISNQMAFTVQLVTGGRRQFGDETIHPAEMFCNLVSTSTDRRGRRSDFRMTSPSNIPRLSVWPWGVSQLHIMNHGRFQVSYGLMQIETYNFMHLVKSNKSSLVATVKASYHLNESPPSILVQSQNLSFFHVFRLGLIIVFIICGRKSDVSKLSKLRMIINKNKTKLCLKSL